MMGGLAQLAPVDPGELSDGELTLHLDKYAPHNVHKVPTYHFRMVHTETGAELGLINLRIGFSAHIERYAGHVGYVVHPDHRGHHYAARSVRLLLPLAKGLRINPVWITCDPGNKVSQRTLELAGAELVETVDVPKDCIIFKSGALRKCRYRIWIR